MPVTAYKSFQTTGIANKSVFLWASATDTNSLQVLLTRLSALPPPAVQPLRTQQKHMLTYRVLRPLPSNDPSHNPNSAIHHISLPHHQADPSSQYWIHDDTEHLSMTELGGSFSDIFQRMDTGWQERQGTTVNLEGRGFEWGRDWRIWCANFQQGNRYRGVVVEVQYMPCDSLPASKLLLTEFAERHIFRSGESVRPFWGRRIYQNLGKQGEEQPKDEREFEDWHTALQYIEMVQYASVARRKSSID